MRAKKASKDPFFGLKFIAFCRTGLPKDDGDIDEEALFAFAKWQICKVRNILWNDPIWDSYTMPELLIEYFAIKFEDSPELRQEFEAQIVQVSGSDLAWLESMEERYKQEQPPEEGIIKESEYIEEKAPEEFEDTF